MNLIMVKILFIKHDLFPQSNLEITNSKPWIAFFTSYHRVILKTFSKLTVAWHLQEAHFYFPWLWTSYRFSKNRFRFLLSEKLSVSQKVKSWETENLWVFCFYKRYLIFLLMSFLSQYFFLKEFHFIQMNLTWPPYEKANYTESIKCF